MTSYMKRLEGLQASIRKCVDARGQAGDYESSLSDLGAMINASTDREIHTAVETAFRSCLAEMFARSQARTVSKDSDIENLIHVSLDIGSHIFTAASVIAGHESKVKELADRKEKTEAEAKEKVQPK